MCVCVCVCVARDLGARLLGVMQGEDPEAVDALLDVIRADSIAHPAYVGGPATPTQQLRRSTPPQGLSAEACQGLRRAAEKLFQVGRAGGLTNAAARLLPRSCCLG